MFLLNVDITSEIFAVFDLVELFFIGKFPSILANLTPYNNFEISIYDIHKQATSILFYDSINNSNLVA